MRGASKRVLGVTYHSLREFREIISGVVWTDIYHVTLYRTWYMLCLPDSFILIKFDLMLITMHRSQGLLLDPSEGEVPAATSAGGNGSLIITAVLTVDTSGALGGDITVQISGLEDTKRIAFSATGVKHTFDLVESNGVLISEVREHARG